MKRVLALLLAMACVGCVSGKSWRRHSSGAPTCQAVCDHYTGCRGISDDQIHTACVTECREIFYEEGQPDTRSLKEFQNLECSEAVAFVEGSSGRPPGTRATTTSTGKRHEAK